MIGTESACVDELVVPIKLRSYRSYRNIQALTAVLLASLLAALCWFGYHLLFDRFALPLSWRWIACLFCFLFYALLASTMLWCVTHLVLELNRNLKLNLPGLVINRDGIVGNASDNPTGLIRWDQIEKVTHMSRYSKSSVAGRSGIVIILNRHNRPKPGPMMLFFGYDLKLPIRQIFIQQDMIGKSAEGIVRAANAFRARLTA